jgi:hypothetical protein
MVTEGVLHPECARIFRIDKSGTDHTGKPLMLHTHQREVINRFISDTLSNRVRMVIPGGIISTAAPKPKGMRDFIGERGHGTLFLAFDFGEWR